MFRATALAAVVTLVTGASTAGAQDAVLTELYGQGVHRYFALDYEGAYEDFTLAIDNGLRDPRVYYYRGLVASATGRPDEATADWRIGAVLEARGNYSGSIGRSLARIQGAERMELERIRQIARLQERARTTAENRARYGMPGAATPSAPAPSAGLPTAPEPPAPAPAAPPAADAPAVEPPAEEAPATDAPADDAPAPAESPDSGTDPFADDPGMSLGEPTLESDNALSDPFAEPAPGATPPAEQPAADDTMDNAAPSGDDPFGAPSGAGGMDNPFGGGGDDPFGGGSDDGMNPFGN